MYDGWISLNDVWIVAVIYIVFRYRSNNNNEVNELYTFDGLDLHSVSQSQQIISGVSLGIIFIFIGFYSKLVPHHFIHDLTVLLPLQSIFIFIIKLIKLISLIRLID